MALAMLLAAMVVVFRSLPVQQRLAATEAQSQLAAAALIEEKVAT